ncbi:flagellar hook-basal body complex protein FliE [Thermosyntropha sp.]|uniref:flagellar hook-basal body complex protein FliE n=1 Tax=Thermosyntropha sp. TaxID=2740820 RepID=UPI0025D8ADE3|nr:flagellar hook-basal body complex protein FliE [Thermosyntropha sp.]MBO8159345.1 flagellar hook-basal body complex protein FliE [Thermosyntropha sp.]
MKPVALDSVLLNTDTVKSSNKNESLSNETSFIDLLNQALNEVDRLQKNASQSAMRLITGEEEYLHNVMIAYEKASLALQLTVEVRNKIIEAYHELMRMQM